MTISGTDQQLARGTNKGNLGAMQAAGFVKRNTVPKSQIVPPTQPSISDTQCPRSQGEKTTNYKQMRSYDGKTTQRMSPSENGS